MERYVTSIALVGVMLALSGMAWASGSVDLDKKQLREGLASRIENAIKQKRPDSQIDVKPSHVKLQRVEPTSASVEDMDIPLYAIKASVKSPVGKGQPSTVKMIVDRSGELQLSVQEVANGRSLFQKAKDVVSSKKIDPSWGQTVFEGAGSQDVFLVIDPFCGYCRKAVSWFMDHREKVGELRIMQVPYAKKRGSDVVSWAFTDGSEVVAPKKLLAYLYSGDLKPLKKGASEEDKSRILKQVMQEFPALKKKWGTAEQGYYYLKGKFEEVGQKNIQIAQKQLEVRATPGVFVDGVPVKGWNPQRYGELLAEK